jgi:hypothetical protein
VKLASSIDIAIKCNGTGCNECYLYNDDGTYGCIQQLATEVQRLRDEREKNPGVWDAAPEDANSVEVLWFIKRDRKHMLIKKNEYIRTIKTPAQRIAAELSDDAEVQELIVAGIERAGKLD